MHLDLRTIEVDDDFRRAFRRAHGKEGLATRKEIRTAALAAVDALFAEIRLNALDETPPPAPAPVSTEANDPPEREEEAVDFLDAFGPATTVQLAEYLGTTVDNARWTLNQLRRRGLAAVVGAQTSPTPRARPFKLWDLT